MRALVLGLLLSCATSKAQPDVAQQVVASSNRNERDRGMDSHRKPVAMLAFFGVAPGMRVGEVGAGGGYTTELLARTVGPNGTVIAQDTPNWDGPGLQKAWTTRLAKPEMKNTTHVMRQWDEPFPPEVSGLDAVYSVAVYHDCLAEKGDSGKMNAAIFRALKPGGVYAIIDNSAKDGTGAADVERLHRVDEQLVRSEVLAAGFQLAGEAGFLRNPADSRDWNADPGSNKTHDQDRFALRFVKP